MGGLVKMSSNNAHQDPFVRVRAMKERGRGIKASDDGERVTIVVPLSSEEMLVI